MYSPQPNPIASATQRLVTASLEADLAFKQRAGNF